jgi:hypothetical protein
MVPIGHAQAEGKPILLGAEFLRVVSIVGISSHRQPKSTNPLPRCSFTFNVNCYSENPNSADVFSSTSGVQFSSKKKIFNLSWTIKKETRNES